MGSIVRHEHAATLSVAENANDSDAFPSIGLASGTVQLPAAITGTAINFKVSNDDENYTIPLTEAGTALANITVAAGNVVAVPAVVWRGKSWKLTFITAQAAARTVLARGKA